MAGHFHTQARSALLTSVLATANGGIALSEISKRLNLRATTIHNILKTLRLRGYVDQETATAVVWDIEKCIALGREVGKAVKARG